MSADPQVREFEKRIANEAQQDQRTLDHAIKDLAQAEKSHTKSGNVAEKAKHAVDKAIKAEYKASSALNSAQHKHDDAIVDHQAKVNTLDTQIAYEKALADTVEKRRTSTDEMQHRKDHNDRRRELELSQMHASRAGSLDTSSTSPSGDAGPVGIDDGSQPSSGTSGPNIIGLAGSA